MALMGALNIVGTIASGYLCDRVGKARPLATFYFFRGLSLLFLLWVSSLWQVMFGLVGLSMSKEDSEAGEAVVQLVFSPIMSIFAGTATIITLFIVGLIISLVVFLYHFAGEGIPGVVCIVLAVLMLLSAGAKPASEVIVVIFRR